jgi:Domain of unknown function (DUF4468) with TBP-like fold
MKKLLLILLLPLAAHAQQAIPANIDSFSFVYTGIQQVPGVSARIIQSRARLFIAQTYQNPRDITRYDDTDGGIFIAFCTIEVLIKRPKTRDSTNFGTLTLPITLHFRNGKYKYDCSQITHQGKGGFYNGGLLTNKVPADRLMEKSDWLLARISARNYVQEFLDEFNAALQSDDLDPDKSDF